STCCISADCAAVTGETCSGIGGSCVCPSGQKGCLANHACIANATCCTTADCTVSGQSCSGPGGAGDCPAGQKVCSANNACINNANCCTNSDCPLTSNTAATSCSGAGGSCQINSCASGFVNVDTAYSDGCECGDVGIGKTCGTATVRPT